MQVSHDLQRFLPPPTIAAVSRSLREVVRNGGRKVVGVVVLVLAPEDNSVLLAGALRGRGDRERKLEGVGRAGGAPATGQGEGDGLLDITPLVVALEKGG